MRANKSQMFSIDLMISLVFFVIILLSIAWAWEFSREKMSLAERRNNMNLLAMFSLSALIETPGNPTNWSDLENDDFDESTMKSLGFASSAISPWILDHDKIQKLFELRQTKYETIKNLLGLRGPGYEFNIKVQMVGGFLIPGFLGAKKIAYTYADGDPLEGNESSFGIRQYLIDNNVHFENYEDDWQTLISEIDNYDGIVFEDPQLRENDLTQEQLDTLENWVINGGVYLQKQFGRLIELFNVTTNNVAHEWGTVIALDSMLANVEINDSIYVIEGYRISKQGPLTQLVQHDTSGHMLMGYWDYGEGRVYYLPDTEGEVYNLTGGIIYNNTRILLDLPQNKAQLIIGLEPEANASNIIVVNRLAMTENAYMNISLTLWERCTGVCR